MSRETHKTPYSNVKSTGGPKPQVNKRTNKSEDITEGYYKMFT